MENNQRKRKRGARLNRLIVAYVLTLVLVIGFAMIVLIMVM